MVLPGSARREIAKRVVVVAIPVREPRGGEGSDMRRDFRCGNGETRAHFDLHGNACERP